MKYEPQTCPQGINQAVCYLTCIMHCNETKMAACPAGRKQKRPRVGGRAMYTRLYRPSGRGK